MQGRHPGTVLSNVPSLQQKPPCLTTVSCLWPHRTDKPLSFVWPPPNSTCRPFRPLVVSQSFYFFFAFFWLVFENRSSPTPSCRIEFLLTVVPGTMCQQRALRISASPPLGSNANLCAHVAQLLFTLNHPQLFPRRLRPSELFF